jgi:hypothetical protein
MLNLLKLRPLILALLIAGLPAPAPLPTGLPALTPVAWAAEAGPATCAQTLKQLLKGFHPTTHSVVDKMDEFARKHNLPTQVVYLGPPDRQVPRLLVGLDVTNPGLLQDYLRTFALEKPLDEVTAGSLVLEFQRDNEAYVTGVLRPGAETNSQIYRWGKPELPRDRWWSIFMMGEGGRDVMYRAAGHDPRTAEVLGYAHVIGLDQAELGNVKTYLAHPELRGPCKSDNCVAWTSTIELGRTALGATDAERRALFTELGMSRAMAHFEIGRRLVHAANERHGAIFLFPSGAM